MHRSAIGVHLATICVRFRYNMVLRPSTFIQAGQPAVPTRLAWRACWRGRWASYRIAPSYGKLLLAVSLSRLSIQKRTCMTSSEPPLVIRDLLQRAREWRDEPGWETLRKGIRIRRLYG